MLSKLEFATAAIYHASPFFLAALDRVQDRFLDALGISREIAVIELKLAPLQARRDIALLGLLHRIVLMLAPAHFSDFVRLAVRPVFPQSYRVPAWRHSRQLHDPTCGAESRMLQRSFLWLIYTYNLLPQKVVKQKSVKLFQNALQRDVIQGAHAGVRRWEALLLAWR